MIRTAMGVAAQNTRRIGGLVPMPRFLTWTLNYRCNARCLMCDSWRKTNVGELGAEAALEVVGRIPKTVSVVRVTGGEPFLREDIDVLVDALAIRLRLDVLHVTSNGFLTRRIVEFLSGRRMRTGAPLRLLVSLDGAQDLHNEIRGREFAFGNAMETIREVAANRRPWNVELAVNQTVVDERGIRDYEELHILLKGLSVPHHVVLAYEESATYSIASEHDASPDAPGSYRPASSIDHDLLARFFERVSIDTASLPVGNRIAKLYYLEGIRNRVLKGVGLPNPRCAALGGHLRILPNGDVPVCQFNGRVVGNILRDGFDSVWTSRETRDRRKWVEKCPGCWAECEVLPSAILDGDILRHVLRRARRP